MDKYANDRFDREKYIPKGYILPDGTMLTKQYARFHSDMAEKYINENWKYRFENDIVRDPMDFMITRLDALQVLSCGKPIVIYCRGNNNRIIQDAVVSYLSYGWKEIVLDNPYKSFTNYMRTRLVNNGFSPYDKTLTDMNVSQLSSILLELESMAQVFTGTDKTENINSKIEEVKNLIREKQKFQGFEF